MATIEYIPLDALAAMLRLPRAYLRRLAEQGKIPSLNVNNYRRFNPAAVQAALDELAKGGDHAES